MSVSVQVRNLTKTYGAVRVLDGGSTAIPDGAKVGVLGRNGAGKSTLCRIILGLEEADSGDVIISDGVRIGYLEQHDAFTVDETPIAYLERRTEKPEWRCGEVAGKLGLRGEVLDRKMGELPGGWRTRVKLAAMLLADPDFLVLDEPTNFLDLSTVMLLQGFLADFRGGAMIVSHDREFLKRTCDHTLSVERGLLTLYPGDVEEFFGWQAEQMDVARRTNLAIESRRAHLQTFVDRFGAKASKATQAQSKRKAIERLQPIAIANPLATVRIRIPQVEVKRGAALGLEDVSIGYPDRVVAKNVSMHVERGARIAIVGDNGQGKTTLLRTLAGDLATVQGSVWRAPNLEIGVYAQHVYHALHPDDTVKSHLERCAAKDVLRQAILDLAGAFLFPGDDVLKPVRVLSGGERARLCLAGMLLMKRPVLLLDEPTNHLDFETVEALGTALRDFAGTVVFISHDRTFVNMVATEIVEVADGRVRVVPGTYADYVEELEKRSRDVQDGGRAKKAAAGATTGTAGAAPARTANPPKRNPPQAKPAQQGGTSAAPAAQARPQSSPPQSVKPVAQAPAQAPVDHRHRRAELARLENARKKVDQKMATLEARRTELHAELEHDPANYRPNLYAQVQEVEREMAFAESEWLDLSEKIESQR
ncbi:MAG: ABC-F family ATP-binding cassette domain-containing protein [Planctomycetes bacterium]|nr:ABC-F family ATP-binding cassette domain-containing protein [Planctomycetota bacterium]